MAMDRWNPWQDVLAMRDAVDRAMQEVFRPSGGHGSFPMDVAETENGYTVHASLPGFTPDDVQIHVSGNTLTIRGEHREEPQPQNQGQNPTYLLRERRMATVYRSITLPASINADQAQATFSNGVLTLTLPRAQSNQPKQIPIGTGTQTQIGQNTAPPTTSATSTTTTTPATPANQGSPTTSGPASQSGAANGATQSGDTTRTGSAWLNAVDQASAESFPASDPPSTSSTSP
jgi:HSP20 family protein